MKIYAVVIIYNKHIKDSVAVNNIIKLNNDMYSIILFDNSSSEFQKSNKEYAQKKGMRYLYSNKNKGLSQAYNQVIDNLKKNNQSDLVLLLDDDTNVTIDFLQKLIVTLNMHPNNDVYMPLIVGQNNIIYSPNEKGLLKNKLKKSPINDLNKKKINGINSCTAIRLWVFDDFRYDENLFVDCVDDYFFDFVREKNLNVYIIDTIIKQNFSQRGKNLDIKYIMPRFKTRIIDNMQYYNKNMVANIIGFIRCFGWSIQYALIMHSFRFFYVCGLLSISLFCRNVWHKIYKFKKKEDNK